MARNETASSNCRTAATAADVGFKGSAEAPGDLPDEASIVPEASPVAEAPGAGVGAPPELSMSNDLAAETSSPPVADDWVPLPAKEDVIVQITLVCGGLSNVKVPVVIAGRYDGLPIAGATKAFDRLLDLWLTRAVDLGLVGSGLGQLFPINLQKRLEAGKVNTGNLLLANMGEPGRFAPDDLRFLMSNVIVAVKSMGHDQFATSLIGTRRHEMTIADAVRGFAEGILDGYERFRAIANVVTDDKTRFHEATQRPLYITIADPSAEKVKQIEAAFKTTAGERALPGLNLRVVRGGEIPPDAVADANAVDTEPDVPVTLLRATRPPTIATAAAANAVQTPGKTELFQFSALSDVAVVPVREQEINAYLIRELPDRIMKTTSPKERDEYATFLGNVLIPDDFRKLINGGNLTLEVDETTAMFPWEMVAQKKYARTSYLGIGASVSRQFRTLLSPVPSSPPPLNKSIRVLIIGDPAPGDLSLPHAREEAVSVVDILHRARNAWRGEYDLRATVRIGSCQDSTPNAVFEDLRKRGSWVESVGPCDPLELAMLIVNEQYDVIHYAGHGLFEKQTGRAGWVFDRDCFLSASEIFRVRQVPRLVFANACFSAATSDQNEQRGHLVGLAHAFFARGIPNFIGTGWQVDDATARECARWFYARVLGLRSPDETNGIIGASPPATIGEALREARRNAFLFKAQSSSWGAYQHYGRVSDKLLPLPNARATSDADIKAAETARPAKA